MRRIVRFNVDVVVPCANEVIESQGMAGRVLPERIRALLDSALELFGQLAEPTGIMEQWPIADFPAVFDGNGLNAPDGPVRTIVPKADALALFAATLGNALVAKSTELFTKGGPALGFMLDAVNSSGAERLGKAMGQRFLELLPEKQRPSEHIKVQYYSPGYCGWHISSQTKLFEALRPEEIGITLNANHVMLPVKSISGILVAGDMQIHEFIPDFPFCKECKTHKCRERLARLERDN